MKTQKDHCLQMAPFNFKIAFPFGRIDVLWSVWRYANQANAWGKNSDRLKYISVSVYIYFNIQIIIL